MMKLLLVPALLTVGTFVLASPTFASDADYRAKAMAFLAQDINDARNGGSTPKVFLDLVDLNGDDVPEALVRIVSPFSCGSMGCTAYVLDLRGASVRSIGDFTANSLTALPTKTGPWRDISVNGHKEVYLGGKYVPAH